MRATMPRAALLTFLLTAALLPTVADAQLVQANSPQPSVDYDEWRFSNEPMTLNGLVYYPTRGTRLFDAQVMTQTGVYRSIPIYADVTMPPLTVVYVPIGRGVLRAYEQNASRSIAPVSPPRAAPQPIGTAGAAIPAPAASSTADVPRPARTHMESVRRPDSQNGIWLEFNGTRYYVDGAPIAFDPARFTQIGDYRGFPVFRGRDGSADAIWIPVMKDTADGRIVRYAKR